LYSEIVEMDHNTKLLQDTSEVSLLMVDLFGGPLEPHKDQGPLGSILKPKLSVDGWIALTVET
jgi:hypothetical protein